ncbi:CDGSH iron-sulfur domain-containing protein [Embleya sp. NPDC005575]|uniref:CDGSH iron-sulfur domain-containing protein n=1 Tax=Embleya sp. NPDC005575 TaxID=3156892 RepID=UPI0033A11F3C
MPRNADRPRRITADRDGPLLIEGPVEVALPGGEILTSHRFVVAICTCRRSRTYPWCDTSHRARTASAGAEPSPDERATGTTDEGSHP